MNTNSTSQATHRNMELHARVDADLGCGDHRLLLKDNHFVIFIWYDFIYTDLLECSHKRVRYIKGDNYVKKILIKTNISSIFYDVTITDDC